MMTKLFFCIVTLSLVFLSNFAFAENWEFCNGCSANQKESIARSYAPAETGSTGVNIGDAFSQTVVSYNVGVIIESEPGINIRRLSTQEVQASQEVISAANTAFAILGQFDLGQFSSEDLGLSVSNAGYLVNSTNQATASEAIGRKMEGVIRAWSLAADQRLEAVMSGIEALDAKIVFSDGSYAKLAVIRVAKYLDSNGFATSLSITLEVTGLFDSLGQNIPLEAEGLSGSTTSINSGNMAVWNQALQNLGLSANLWNQSSSTGGTMYCEIKPGARLECTLKQN